MSKLPKLLEDLASEIDQGFIEDTFEVLGKKYKLRLLSDGEANWKNRFIDGFASGMAILSQRKSATLAVAIREIEGQNVIAIFTPAAPAADEKAENKKEYDEWSKATELERQFIVARKMYDYLSKRPSDFTTELYNKFDELEARRKEVVKNIKNS